MSSALTPLFQEQSDSQSREKAPSKDARPFSIRLTDEEKAHLKKKAGRRPLGAYCRDVLLKDKEMSRRSLRSPALEDSQYAALLAALGQSNLSSNLNQLAKHANMGTLDVSSDTELQLQAAYEAVIEMRKALLMALGMKFGVEIKGEQ